VKACAQSLVSCLWNNNRVFRNTGNAQVLKNRKKEFFSLVELNYVLNKVVARQSIKLDSAQVEA
jgi:hypothetical protein